MEAAIITTYRCINKCHMCNIWKHPTDAKDEISCEILKKLPRLNFVNITGGEPFIREDIEVIVDVLSRKARRVVISTNGYFTEKIVTLAKKFKNKNLGIRISIEGLPAANDELRGLKDCFDHGLRTLLELHRLGLKDIGFGITVSDRNAKDMLELYELAKAMNVEFATACVHNSYYFHKNDNSIANKTQVIRCFEQLINELLGTKKMKNWFRAYFNYGLVNYIKGYPRLLPCEAGSAMFFVDPGANIIPCNGFEHVNGDVIMGNLYENSFEEIWNSDNAKRIRQLVRNCLRNCWMIGTASPAMKKNLFKVLPWVIKNKLLALSGKRICVS